MVDIRNVCLKYGDRTLFNNLNLTFKESERIGLIGRNGAGKSTLLKIIAGHLNPDSGNIHIPNSMSLGFLTQDLYIDEENTVLHEAMTAFDDLNNLEDDLAKYNLELTTREDYETDSYMELITKVTSITDRLGHFNVNTVEATAVKLLKGLGFTDENIHNTVSTFSGGWKMRVELAKLLLRQPDVLMLDEPTNHLDIESIIWLESYIKDYSGIVVVISHDQEFLDNVCNRIVEIELGRIYDFKANYSGFMLEKVQQKSILESTIKNQQKEIADKEKLIEKFRAKASKAKFAQSLMKQLDRMEVLDPMLEDSKVMNLRFPAAPRSGQVVSKAIKLSKSYGNNEVLHQVDFQIERGERVAFVGQNGQGKTTLAKMLTQVIEPTTGDIEMGHNVSVGYFAQDQPEQLDGNITLLETVENKAPAEMRSKARSLLGAFLFSGEDVDKKVKVLSGGERSRLALACLIMQSNNFLLLDEPTNHLDIIAKHRLKEALQQFDGTLLIVSHDRSFMDGLTTKTIEFKDKQIKEHLGDVTEFLKSRAAQSFRQIEKDTVPQKKVVEEKTHTLTRDEEKMLKRKVSYIERDIAKYEEEIKKLELEMAEPEFYKREDCTDITKQHAKLQGDLEAKMEEWELAILELG